MFKLFLNSKCREAIKYAKYLNEWNDSYNAGAKAACKMFHKYLTNNRMGNYKTLKFVTCPCPPYYFMAAHLERELNVIRAINVENGVIKHNTNDALKSFVKYIHILETKESPKQLAQMIHCFHAGMPMSLVLEHSEDSWRAEQNAPEYIKNEDGSITLTYDLIHTGRSVEVKQCTLNVSPEYKVSLNCISKPKNNI